MKNLTTMFDLLLLPKVFSCFRSIFSIKHLLFIGMMLGTPLLHANTCATAEVITTITNPVTGSVQDGNGNVNEYYYSISPGVAAILTLSSYSSTDNTSVYLSTSCPPASGDRILNNGQVLPTPGSASLTISAGQTFYISIDESTNQSKVANYQFNLSLVTSTPTVTDAIFNINENASNGILVGTVSTTDGAPTSFTIVSGNDDGIFQIDDSGVLTVADNTDLDYESATSHDLTVRADNTLGNGTSGTITIDINDIEEDPPIVSNGTFSISETSSNGTLVGTVSTSGGTPASFIIVSGNSDGIFTIDNTGIITVLDNSNLDYATTNSYSLEIQASNIVGSDTGTTVITITQASNEFDTSNPRDFVKVNADTNIFGDLVMIGNQSLCWKNGTSDCVEPPSGASNNDYTQHNINKDSIADDAGYANSTSSDLTLGPDDIVVEAWLYWIGRIDDEDSKRALANTVRLRVPGASTYTTITSLASKFNWMTDGDLFDYGGGANITSYVQAAGGGTYWVADLQATEMSNQGSGWTIAVIVRDTTTNTRTMKNISLYDGFQGVFDGDNDYPDSVTSTISGFRTPNSGTIDSNLIVFAGESDRSLNDSLSITNSTGTVLLQDSRNTTSNVQNGTISKDGANVISRNPNYENTLGVDIDEIDTSDVLDHDQQSTDITVTSNGDRIFLAMYGFATELYIPQLCYDYAYKQYDRYFTEDNNGSSTPDIVGTGLSTSAPITVELFFQNVEDSDILFSNVTVDITDINTSQATYVANSTFVINPGEVFPLQYDTLTGIPINDIDSQDYFFLDYSLDPLTTSINMPLGADIHYEIVFADGSGVTSTIPHTTNIDSMPLCSALNFAYEPIYGVFNVEDAALAGSEDDTSGQLYNLPTQTANRPGNYKIAAYDFVNRNTRKDVSTIVAVELIDAGKYHGIDASCTEPGSALTPRIWVTFGTTADSNVSLTDFNAATIQHAIDNGLLSTDILNQTPLNSPGEYYQNVRENAAFRISYNTPGDGDLLNLELDSCTGQQVAPCWRVNNFPDLSQLNLGAGAGNCAQDIDGNINSTDKIPQNCGNAGAAGMDSIELATCMECIYGYNINFLCSRDNFAIRPESFRVQLKDQDQSDATQQSVIALNDDISIVHDNDNENNTGYQIAAGYQYALEVNATNHENETPTPGYDVSFLHDGDDGTRTFQLKWHDIANNADCNVIEDQNQTATFFDGQMVLLNGQIDLNISSNQVGKYDLNLFDKLWTRVDWDPTAMTHQTGTHFLTGKDCVENSSYVPQFPTDTTISGINLANVSGCDITSSNHTNTDTTAQFADLPLRVHPYKFSTGGLTVGARPTNDSSNNAFVYINTPDLNLYPDGIDENMSYNVQGTFAAVGKDSGRLSNFVDNCYADSIHMSLYQNYNHIVPALEPYLSYDLIDHNTTDSSVIIRARENDIFSDYNLATTDPIVPLVIDQTQDYFEKDMEGSITMDLGYNFVRAMNAPLNPRHIHMRDFNLTYTTPPTGIYADLTNTHEIFGNINMDQNVTFMYGRAKPAQTYYETINNNIDTPVSVIVYCDLGYTECQNRNIMALVAQTSEANWWKSWDHNNNPTLSGMDGTIELVSAPTSALNDTSVTIVSEGEDPTVNVNNGGVAPLLVPVNLVVNDPAAAAPADYTDRWLIYNEYSATTPPIPFYRVKFLGASGWVGKGDTGHVVGDDVNTKNNRRLEW